MSQYRVRFAPSPTGHLHVGGARTAIYNWLFARHSGGINILRIDDTDPERSTHEATTAIMDSLRWLGLDWDEGPEVGGAYGPYFQSQRSRHYDAAAARLLAEGKAYRCFCAPEELEARREAAVADGRAPGYDRRCRDLPDAERAQRSQAGTPSVLRLAAPFHGQTRFRDVIRGEMIFPNNVLDDYVLVRNDGTPTYNFASVVDDAAMKVTHVIRGDDHLSNTPRQIILFDALGEPVPAFAHMPMTWGTDRRRLSKRHGAASIESYRDAGYLPEALLNYLTLLGWSLDDKTTFFTRAELVRHFDIARVSKNPSIFDPDKLAWMNGCYIRELPDGALLDRMLPFLERAGLLDVLENTPRRDWLLQLIPLVRERMKTLAEAVDLVDFFFTKQISIDPESAAKALSGDDAKVILQTTRERLAALEPFKTDSIEETLRALPDRLDCKPKRVFQAVRVAVTGKLISPPLFETIDLLGKESTVQRLDAAIAYVESVPR